MAIPSGSGTEVLKVTYKHALTNSAVTMVTGVPNHTYTVISVIFTEMGSAAETISMYVDAGAVDVSSSSGQDIYLLNAQALASGETFIWNDKIVLSGTDALKVVTGGSANVDVVCSFIDQDWS